MVRTASLFSQLLGLFPRLEFEHLVRRHQAERYAKGFTCWNQFVAMLFAQLAQAQSLREICGGLRCCLGKLAHLGVREAPKRSTLAYANAHRPWLLYADLFYVLLGQVHGISDGPGHKLRFRHKLLSLDSSVIELCLSLFPWAKLQRGPRAAVKLHCVLDHDGYFPVLCAGHPGQTIRRLRRPAPEASRRLHRRYRQRATRTTPCGPASHREGVFFVTRMVKGIQLPGVARRPVPQHRHILADEVIVLTSKRARRQECTQQLRRVVVWLPEKQEELVLITNHLIFGASTIAAIYKERWQIELFFKALKQNLRIKTFVGTSENALHIQIWTALIAMLLLK